MCWARYLACAVADSDVAGDFAGDVVDVAGCHMMVLMTAVVVAMASVTVAVAAAIVAMAEATFAVIVVVVVGHRRSHSQRHGRIRSSGYMLRL